jgi:tetratricopeptide (TPR) repeat protein
MFNAGDMTGALEAARRLRELTDAAGDVYVEAAYDRALAAWQTGRMLCVNGRPEEALSVLEDAQLLFSKLSMSGNRDAANMVTVATTDKGNALLTLGRLDEAATVYEDCLREAKGMNRKRSVAVCLGQLGAVRLNQGRHNEALVAFQEIKIAFEELGEPRMIATAWHQIGMVHAIEGTFAMAEHAFRTSLAMATVQRDRAGEARTLHELASLHEAQGKWEDAAALYRQAADLDRTLGNRLKEAMSLSNIGFLFHHLQRFDEAREALVEALAIKQHHGHAAQSWKTWTGLEALERDTGRSEAACEARLQALRTYRAYRADGGEPMDAPARSIAAFGQMLHEAGPDAARALLPEPDNVAPWLVSALRAVHAIAAGNRDPGLAENPAIFSLHAVELALLLESLPPVDATSAPAEFPIDICPCGSGAPFPLCHGAADPGAP